MTVPLPPVPQIHPEVIIPPQPPSPALLFLQSFQQGIEQGQRAAEFRAQMAAEQQRIDLERQRLSYQTTQDYTARVQAAAAGRALANAFAGINQPAAGGAQTVDDLRRQAGLGQQPTDQYGIPTTLPWRLQGSIPGVPPSPGPPLANSTPQSAPNATMPLTRPPSLDLVGTFTRTLAENAPPEVLMKALETATPLVHLQATMQEKEDEFNRTRDILGRTIKDPEQLSAALGLTALAAANVHPSDAITQMMFPQLRQLGGIDPQTFGAAREMWTAGGSAGLTWGAVRQSLGIPKSTVPDSLVYLGPQTTKDQKPTEDQLRAGTALQQMSDAASTIFGLQSQGVQIDWRGSFIRRRGPGFLRDFVNDLTDEKQQQLVNAQIAFADAWNTSAHGVRASDKDMDFVLRQTAIDKGDDPNTVAQKQALMVTMMKAIKDRADGRVSPTGMIDQVLGERQWTPDVRTFLNTEKARIATDERNTAAGFPPITATPDPITPDQAPAVVQRWGQVLSNIHGDSLGARPRRPATKARTAPPQQTPPAVPAPVPNAAPPVSQMPPGLTPDQQAQHTIFSNLAAPVANYARGLGVMWGVPWLGGTHP